MLNDSVLRRLTHTTDRSELSRASESETTKNPSWVVVLLVALPIVFNSIALLPEVRYSTPNTNDQVFHYLFIERANQAISAGDNPFDHWLPELEIGFPQFLYYQNVPHLTVVALYHLFLEKISLRTLLDSIRYLLLVLFPLTVYWSMRRMEFSPIAAAVGAAFAPLLASKVSLGFDYESYVWRGFGMFPQLCSMHLMFIGAACIQRVLRESRGYCAAIIVSAGMVLSDLLYGYIFAIVVAILWAVSLVGSRRDKAGLIGVLYRARRSSARLAMVALPAALITAYQTIPFFAQLQYVNDAQLEPWKHRSIEPWSGLLTLCSGQFFDNGRLPFLTALVFIGVIHGLIRRPKGTGIALMMLGVWSALLFGGQIARQLPIAYLVPFQRFSSGIDFGAILAAGLGGELLWQLMPSPVTRARTLILIALIFALYAPALTERWNFLSENKAMMETSDIAIKDDSDLPKIMSALRAAPPGRVYAGTRGNWGSWMKDGFIHLFDLLPVEQFSTAMPWQTLSLNAPYLWRLVTPSMQECSLFNISYIIAPPDLPVPQFYRTVVTTSRYVLYRVDSGGYLQLGRVSQVTPMGSSSKLLSDNRAWLNSEESKSARFLAYVASNQKPDATLTALIQPEKLAGDSGDLGLIDNEIVTPDSFEARVTADSRAALIFKSTYHPNWHVWVDGREQQTFMVSPSFLGVMVESGHHQVRGEYRSSVTKKALLALGGIGLLITMAIWILGMA